MISPYLTPASSFTMMYRRSIKFDPDLCLPLSPVDASLKISTHAVDSSFRSLQKNVNLLSTQLESKPFHLFCLYFIVAFVVPITISLVTGPETKIGLRLIHRLRLGRLAPVTLLP